MYCNKHIRIFTSFVNNFFGRSCYLSYFIIIIITITPTNDHH